jgi:hypothetical protein
MEGSIGTCAPGALRRKVQVTGRLVLWVMLAALVHGGCSKERKSPQRTAARPKALRDPATLPHAERAALLRRALERKTTGAFAVFLIANNALPDFPGSFDFPEGKTSPALIKAMERACPFLDSPTYGSISQRDRTFGVWSRCVKKLNIMSRTEALRRPARAIFAPMVYQYYKDFGLQHRRVWTLVRAWLGPDPFAQLEAVGISLPKTLSSAKLTPRASLFVSKGRVALAMNPIPPLRWMTPKALTARLKTDAAQWRKTGLTLFADDQTPYNTLYSVLRSVGVNAGKHFKIQLAAVERWRGLRKVSVQLAAATTAPAAPTTKGGHRPLDLTLVIKPDGFALRSRHGAECPYGTPKTATVCFSRKRLMDLRLHLWYLLQVKYKSCSNDSSDVQRCLLQRQTLRVIGYPQLTHAELIRTLDAVQEIPSKSRNPPPPEAHTWSRMRLRCATPVKTNSPIPIQGNQCMYWRTLLLPPQT